MRDLSNRKGYASEWAIVGERGNKQLKKFPKRDSPFTLQEESQILIDKSIGMTAEQTLRHWLFDGKRPNLADIKRVRGEL